MTRRASPSEALALQSARDEAREVIRELFPRALFAINIGRGEKGLGLVATFADPTPHHDAGDLVTCLADMGVHSTTMVDPQILNPALKRKSDTKNNL